MNYLIKHNSPLLSRKKECECIWADLPFLCLPSLMWRFGQRLFLHFPPLRRRGSYEPKKKKIWRKIRRRPHLGNCAEVRLKRPPTTEDCTPIFHQASCRHLQYMRLFPHSHLPHRGSSGSSHSMNSTHPHCQTR